jgi:hypothetical protein
MQRLKSQKSRDIGRISEFAESFIASFKPEPETPFKKLDILPALRFVPIESLVFRSWKFVQTRIACQKIDNLDVNHDLSSSAFDQNGSPASFDVLIGLYSFIESRGGMNDLGFSETCQASFAKIEDCIHAERLGEMCNDTHPTTLRLVMVSHRRRHFQCNELRLHSVEKCVHAADLNRILDLEDDPDVNIELINLRLRHHVVRV